MEQANSTTSAYQDSNISLRKEREDDAADVEDGLYTNKSLETIDLLQSVAANSVNQKTDQGSNSRNFDGDEVDHQSLNDEDSRCY